MFKYVCEGRGMERVKGAREVMSNATDFQEEMRRLRRGGGCCEHCKTLKNPEEKGERWEEEGRNGGRRAVWRDGGEKMGVWPSEAFEQQQEQSSRSQSNYFFLLVLKPSWISSPSLPWGQRDITSESSRSEPQTLHSPLFPLKIQVETHYCGFGDICWLNKKL